MQVNMREKKLINSLRQLQKKYITPAQRSSERRMLLLKNDTVTGFYNTGKYPLWVTFPPGLKNFIHKNHLHSPTDTLQLQQLLGLPPVISYTYVIAFCVKPADLFSPMPRCWDSGCFNDLQYLAVTTIK
jgi:hypothetical protein